MTKPLPFGELLNEIPEGDYVTYIVAFVKEAIIKKEYKDFIILRD